MKSLKETIMERDDLTLEEANELIDDARERVFNGENPEEVLMEEFNLEPDYVFYLL